MAREFEVIGLGAITGLLHRKAKQAPEAGARCANCDTGLAGPYCHVCGQDADDHHRSIGPLILEGIEGLTHLDGRLAQTLPLLLFNPGRLARDQLEGRRARHIPPFRLFLVSLLIFMFVLEAVFHSAEKATAHAIAPAPPAAVAIVGSSPPGGQAHTLAAPAAAAQAQADSTAVVEVVDAQGRRHSALGAWLQTHIRRTLANKTYYGMVAFTWAHRLAILLLPILAALLALAYVRRRKVYLYDHLIVAMQFLSFEFLIFGLAWLLPEPLRGWAILAATLWTPVNLYMTLRGAYGSGVLAAGIKTLFLWTSTLFLFGALMVGVLVVALAEM